jgi:aminoglycoside 3-N-acetyltransferase
MLVAGKRTWVQFEDLAINEADFIQLGDSFERETGLVHCGQIGQATARLMPQKALVDYAVTWMEENRH